MIDGCLSLRVSPEVASRGLTREGSASTFLHRVAGRPQSLPHGPPACAAASPEYEGESTQDRSHNIFISLAIEAEKAKAPHSSTLSWKMPWMEEPSRLQSMGSLRVGHD